jgi:hypothetical protein
MRDGSGSGSGYVAKHKKTQKKFLVRGVRGIKYCCTFQVSSFHFETR